MTNNATVLQRIVVIWQPRIGAQVLWVKVREAERSLVDYFYTQVGSWENREEMHGSAAEFVAGFHPGIKQSIRQQESWESKKKTQQVFFKSPLINVTLIMETFHNFVASTNYGSDKPSIRQHQETR